jgi:hypothetical protein
LRVAAAATLTLVAACSKESPPASSQSGQAATPINTTTTATALASAALSVPPPVSPVASGAPAMSGAPATTGTPAADIAPHAIAETQGDDVSTWSLHAKGFPLVSEDGRRVVYVINEEDGMRAYPNYVGFVRGAVDDKIQKRQTLFVANDLHKAERSKTLDAARAAIARNMEAFKPSWQAADLRPMAAMVARAAGPGATGPTGATGATGGPFTYGEWTVEWRDLRLIMTDKAGKKVLDHDAKVWKPKSFKLANGTTCSFEPKLAAVHVYPAKNVLLATLAFVEVAGGDSCNLSDEARVLVWK